MAKQLLEAWQSFHTHYKHQTLGHSNSRTVKISDSRTLAGIRNNHMHFKRPITVPQLSLDVTPFSPFDDIGYPLELDPCRRRGFRCWPPELEWTRCYEKYRSSKTVDVICHGRDSCAVFEKRDVSGKKVGDICKGETHKTWSLLAGYLPDKCKTLSQSL